MAGVLARLFAALDRFFDIVAYASRAINARRMDRERAAHIETLLSLDDEKVHSEDSLEAAILVRQIEVAKRDFG